MSVMTCPGASDRDGSIQKESHRRCILLLNETGEVPESLLTGLERRGADLVVAKLPTELMVMLAEERTHAIIIDDPQRVPQLSELLRALATYYPWVARWSHEATQNGQPRRLLRMRPGAARGPLQEEDPQVSEADDAGAEWNHGMPSGAGTERLTDGGSDAEERLLSEQELRMLIGRMDA